MKIDLCKLLGVEEGEEFKLENTNYDDRVIFKIQDDVLFNGFSGEGLTKSLITLNDISKVTVIKLPKKKEFTDDELCILRNIDKKYKWITRDKSGLICTFVPKPKKTEKFWAGGWSDDASYASLVAIKNSLLNSIQWEDEEPIRIDDYVDRK